MAEALDLNIPLGEGGTESVEKIIKPLLDLEKNNSDETEKSVYETYKSKKPGFISLKSDNKIGKNW